MNDTAVPCIIGDDHLTQQDQGELSKDSLERLTRPASEHGLAGCRDHLADLKVFRVGRTRVAVYLVGKTKDGAWAGVRTTSVET